MILEKIKEYLERFLIMWGVILVLNQLLFFHGCFYANCLITALPHTGVIAFLIIIFTNKKVEEKKNREKKSTSHEEVASQKTKIDDYVGTKKPDINQNKNLLVNPEHIILTKNIQKSSTEILHIKKDFFLETTKKNEYKNIIPYFDFRNIECFYHFTERTNLRSILQSGGLMSFQELRKRQINVFHVSNALSWELDAKKGLSDYIRLSFVKNHPMFWKAKYEIDVELIWIQIDREVAIWENTKFTDKNATDKNANIGNDLGFLKIIDYDSIHKSKDGYNTLLEEEKKYAQAEVLVEQFIPKKYFLNLSELERMI